MKIALTGHTKGIGRAIYEQLSKNHEVVCFSRANTYDINVIIDRQRIIEESKDCDVFINNAYYPYAQTALAEEWFSQYKGENKLLVNIGSYVIEILRDPELYPAMAAEFAKYHIYELWNGYKETKESLEKISKNFNSEKVLTRTILVNPGVVDTELVPTPLRNLFDKLVTCEEVAIVTEQAIDNWCRGIYCTTINVENNYM